MAFILNKTAFYPETLLDCTSPQFMITVSAVCLCNRLSGCSHVMTQSANENARNLLLKLRLHLSGLELQPSLCLIQGLTKPLMKLSCKVQASASSACLSSTQVIKPALHVISANTCVPRSSECGKSQQWVQRLF